MAQDARPRDALVSRLRPRRHRHTSGRGEENQTRAEQVTPRPWPRGVRQRDLEVEGGEGHDNYQSVEAYGLFVRLGQTKIHNGRGVGQGCARSVHKNARERPYLQE